MKELLANSYYLPWKINDNPNGWIEPTTYCNLKCPGCYRGADKPTHKPFHLKLSEVIKQIDWHIDNRNIHTLSISGGDPLLYPELENIIKYASGKNLRTMIYTNGISLNKDLLIKLRNAGATQFLIHIDRYQNRPDNKENLSVQEIQTKFCDLFREVGGVLLGFIQPLSKEYCETDVKLVSDLALKNNDIVSLIVFTLYRDICWDKSLHNQISTDISIKRTIEALKNSDDFIPAAWLGADDDKYDPTWVFGCRIADKNGKTTYFSPAFYRFAHKRYRQKTGRYLFISRNNKLNLFKLLPVIRYSTVKKIWWQHIKSLLSLKTKNKYFFQTILLLRGPEKRNNIWNLCDGCPDRIIYNGRLVPSCILEDIKLKNNNNFKKVEFSE